MKLDFKNVNYFLTSYAKRTKNLKTHLNPDNACKHIPEENGIVRRSIDFH